MTDLRSDAISLPPGSYDYDTLKKGTDAAAKGPKGKYDENVAAALKEANQSEVPDTDPRDTPGYRLETVQHEELGVDETIQVFDAKLAASAQEEGTPAIAPQAATETPAAPAAPASSKE